MEEHFPGGSDFIRRSFRLKGFPETDLETILASLAANTLRQYSHCYKKWWLFNKNISSNSHVYGLEKLINFLNMLVKAGSSYSTINTYRSALALVLEIPRKDEPFLKRYLKGVYKKNTPTSRYTTTWDPQVVLNVLSELDSLDLQKLTYKLIMLMSLITAHRIQTFSQIRISNIKSYRDRVEIIITDKIKTSGPKVQQPILILPFFTQKPELCVASTLKAYLARTIDVRHTNNDFLFLTYKKTYHPATSQTISRWLKQTLKIAGIDTTLYTSYSARHASTSAAFRAGVDISTIRKAAGWSDKSNMFTTFYNRPLASDPMTFAKGVLKGSNISI